MAPRKNATASSCSSIPIGDCDVTVEASKFTCKSREDSLLISVSRSAKIRISVRKEVNKHNNVDDTGNHKFKENDKLQGDLSDGDDFSFVLVNPKHVSISSKSYLQEVLKMYIKELPAMNYAANTGKQSMFLEKCVMNGKYCTLLLNSNSVKEVIAAITFQMVPVDTQYAEIPLAAVSSICQHKGYGRLLFMELRKRLQSVGVCTIFCWGDKESEGFWHKMGFVSVAEVDAKGRARKLPIRADIRRALCIPGGSTLMVLHLKQDISVNYAASLNLGQSVMPNRKSISSAVGGIQPFGPFQEGGNTVHARAINSQPEINNQHLGEDNNLDGCEGPKGQDEDSVIGNLGQFARVDSSRCTNKEVFITADDADLESCSCSAQRSNAKRRHWEASLSSLKSKKVKGSHLVGCHSRLNCSFASQSDRNSSFLQKCSLDALNIKSLVEFRSNVPLASSCMEKNDGHYGQVSMTSDRNSSFLQKCSLDPLNIKSLVEFPSHVLWLVVAWKRVDGHYGQVNMIAGTPLRKEIQSQKEGFKIMLMNIADETKKTHLAKVIEDLGGTVVSDGNKSTHVITGKVRKTLNFCTALCSGAWIVSPCWLKASFRLGRFVDELSYILNDQDYVMKYRAELKDAVLRAKASPGALLKEYDVCMATHVQPPPRTLSAIVRSAGGNIIDRLKKVNEPSKTIFVACEEDMEQMLLAARKGICTYSSDWLMNCVMRQELDLEAPQFAESL